MSLTKCFLYFQKEITSHSCGKIVPDSLCMSFKYQNYISKRVFDLKNTILGYHILRTIFTTYLMDSLKAWSLKISLRYKTKTDPVKLRWKPAAPDTLFESLSEKSNQKRKCVNNQNNSASYFRLCNTVLHHHKKLIFVNLWSENG